jgi:hypothetical protein
MIAFPPSDTSEINRLCNEKTNSYINRFGEIEGFGKARAAEVLSDKIVSI